jgi:subtilase family serine protease
MELMTAIFSIILSPLNYDNLNLSIPIKDLPGEHRLRILLDENNKIEEYNENDNNLDLEYNVSTASIRTTNIYTDENSIINRITFFKSDCRSTGK